MGYVRTYTEFEVSRILRESEEAQGHAESRHELVPVGKGRSSITVDGLEDRALGERKGVVSAFEGSQVQAVTFALNTQAGRNALTYLNNPPVRSVFAKIDVSSQNFKMTMAIIPDVPKIGPLQQPQMVDTFAAFVCMKLMANKGVLHIQTAFPEWQQRPLPQQTAELTYNVGMNQVLPI